MQTHTRIHTRTRMHTRTPTNKETNTHKITVYFSKLARIHNLLERILSMAFFFLRLLMMQGARMATANRKRTNRQHTTTTTAGRYDRLDSIITRGEKRAHKMNIQIEICRQFVTTVEPLNVDTLKSGHPA